MGESHAKLSLCREVKAWGSLRHLTKATFHLGHRASPGPPRSYLLLRVNIGFSGRPGCLSPVVLLTSLGPQTTCLTPEPCSHLPKGDQWLLPERRRDGVLRSSVWKGLVYSRCTHNVPPLLGPHWLLWPSETQLLSKLMITAALHTRRRDGCPYSSLLQLY